MRKKMDLTLKEELKRRDFNGSCPFLCPFCSLHSILRIFYLLAVVFLLFLDMIFAKWPGGQWTKCKQRGNERKKKGELWAAERKKGKIRGQERPRLAGKWVAKEMNGWAQKWPMYVSNGGGGFWPSPSLSFSSSFPPISCQI